MDKYLFFGILSLGVIGVTLVFVVRGIFGKYQKGRLLSPFHTFFAGVFVAVFLSLIPIYQRLLVALHHTLQVFSLDIDRETVQAVINQSGTEWAKYYNGYFEVLFVVAPILTFGFIASLFKDVSANSRLLFHYFSNVYAFSELNPESLALGRSIKSNPAHKKAVILYANAYRNDGPEASELLEEARALRAICFKKDILSVNFSRHSPKSHCFFFAIGAQKTNILLALRLAERYKDRNNTMLYTFSTGAESELLLSKNPGKVIIRRINDVRCLIMRDLYENGRKLFDTAVSQEDGSKRIGAVIVGLGQYGTELLKALSWYGQMEGYHLYIDAFGEDPRSASHLSAQAPELLSPSTNGVVIPGESEYHITIHSGCDFLSQEFYDAISKLNQTNFVFVSLGSDEKNIRVAAELRMRFERIHIHPIIQALVYDSMEKTAMEGVTDYSRQQQYDIECIGSMDSFYSEEVIINPELDQEALRIHSQWSDDKEEFWQFEYNYRSSMASAIHNKLRIELGVDGCGKPESEWSEEERKTIETIEHRRWNAYMRAEGFVYSGSPEKSSRNNLGKMHHNLVPYDILSEEDKRKDARVASGNS